MVAKTWGAQPDQTDIEEFTPPEFVQKTRVIDVEDVEQITTSSEETPPAEPVNLPDDTIVHRHTNIAEPAGPGHNGPPSESDVENFNSAARGQLVAFVERVERLEEEKATIAEDIKEVYAEAKGTGYDVKTIRKAIQRRKMDPDTRAEQDALLELYEETLR